jgi:hypothetical protein
MQVDDGIQAMLMKECYKALDLVLVVGPGVGGGHSVDTQPAVLIEGNPNGVDAGPAGDGGH